jgi:PPK2 family polyphosphate:nucleotide phosphotransferase
MGAAEMASAPRVSDLLRVPAGPVDLEHADARATPGFTGGKTDAKRLLAEHGKRLATLQRMLWAEGRTGGTRSVLLVLQGMDASGKGGTVRRVIGQVDPAGVRVAAFEAPTDEEREHDFLWRIRARLPRAGQVGAFDRSHYEDVVAVRVRGLADESTWRPRFDEINAFEAELAAGGMRIVKCFLHISPEEQRERLLARLDDETKRWKYSAGDLDDRALWGDFQHAYAEAIALTSTEVAPWHLVPADRKWYRNWAIARLLIEQLEEMALAWPAPGFDVEEQRARIRAMP